MNTTGIPDATLPAASPRQPLAPIPGAAVVFGIATLLTIVIAWPVVRAPTQMIYGREIAGRHYDAYTVIEQFGQALPARGLGAQPATDLVGWLLARVLPAVAAYNVIVLLTFPLTAAATYLLARHLLASHGAAAIAAMFFAFAPLRLVHAAYHPHIVQTQWLPLYLLSLFALIDRPTWWRATGVAVSCAGLTLSNYYAGLIGAAITPVAIVAYSIARRSALRSVLIATATVAALAVIGVAVIATATTFLHERPAVAFDISDIGRFSARWWAYFVPPVDQPVVGNAGARALARAGAPTAIVEEQVSLSYGLMALAMFAIVVASLEWRRTPRWRPVVAVAAIGGFAWFVSLGPPTGSCATSGWAPACLLYGVVPMFRSYARFAFAVHLSVAIAAAAGVLMLNRFRIGRVAAAALVAFAAVEYLPLPWRAHDVLPTAGHRWVADQPVAASVFDCVNVDQSLASVPSLMHRPMSFLSAAQPTCADPRLGKKLAMMGYGYVVARRGAGASEPPSPAAKLSQIAEFPDSKVFGVASDRSGIAVVTTYGFYPYEHEGSDWWEWMTSRGVWAIESTFAAPVSASLQVRLGSLGTPRRLVLELDGQPAGRLEVPTSVAALTAGPWTLRPGRHVLTFAASGEPYRPSDHGSTDNRQLTVMFKSDERWLRSPTAVDAPSAESAAGLSR
jgi:hypothetical protein